MNLNVLIVGGGKLIYYLSRTFLSKGYRVTVINRDRETCSRLARRLKAVIVYGDGSDPMILQEAGAGSADAVLAVTPHDPDNLVICQLAALRFRVPRTLALVNDPDNESVFRRLGVKAFSTTGIVANLIEQRAALEEIINLMPVGEGKVNVAEIRLNGTSPVAGKSLREIVLPENALVACIVRDQQAIVPRGATKLHSGDELIVLALPENFDAVIRALTKKD